MGLLWIAAAVIVADLNADLDAVIFDFGGVIINICQNNALEAFGQLSGQAAEGLLTEEVQAALFDPFETGQISAAEFRDGLRQWLEIDCSDVVLDAAWNAMLLDIPLERIAFLRQLGQRKRIFLLSNTNPIHRASFDRIFEANVGSLDGGLSSLFEQDYYSHLMGDRKPNPSIYQTLIDNHGLDPTRTLFIDDTAENLIGAAQVGLNTLHLTQGTTIVDLNLFPG